jgi:FkbM family methyltransferase
LSERSAEDLENHACGKLITMTKSRSHGSEETFAEKLRRKVSVSFARTERLGEHQQKRYLKRLFPLLDIDLVLDVGANAGQFATFLRRAVGFKGPLVSFEPIPELAVHLSNLAARDPKWKIVNAGIGAEDGRLELNVMKSSPLSSFLAPSRAQTDKLSKLNQVARTVAVDVRTIDGFLDEERSEFGECRNIYLKLDVQGYEDRCLDGAMGSLPRISALQAEMSVIPLYDGMPSYLTLMEKLEALGYSLSLAPAHPASQFPEIIDLDMHYVSRDRLRSLGRLN